MPTHLPGLALRLRGPLDLAQTLRPLARWGDDGLDRWDGDVLLRTIRLAEDEPPVGFAARPAGSVARPAMAVDLETTANPRMATDPAPIADAVRRTFDTDPAARQAVRELARTDVAVAALVERHAGFVPILYRDPLTALIRSITAQQVNLRWATEVRARLAGRYGRRHEVSGRWVLSLPAEALAAATSDELRGLQLTTAKARSVVACAREAADGRLRLESLDALGDDELIARLTQLPGIGRWSAEWFLCRTLGRPRVVGGDLGVRKAVGRMYAGGAVPTEADVRRLTAPWGRGAALVQALALHDLAETPPVAPRVRRRRGSPRPRAA